MRNIIIYYRYWWKTYGQKLGFETGTESDAWGWGPKMAKYDDNNTQTPSSKTPRLSHIEGNQSLKVTVDPLDYKKFRGVYESDFI